VAEGSVFKYCSCRDANKRKLGPRCPKLRRPGGAFSPTHGYWGYQLELPAKAGGERRQLRRTSFPSRDDALADRDRAQALLALAAGNLAIAAAIADLLTAVKAGQPLPERDVVARRVRVGMPASPTGLFGDYLWDWHRSRKIEATTLRSYAGHIRNYLAPHLGHLPRDQVQVAHVQAMFDAIAERNIAIEIARQSDDPQIRASVKDARVVSAATMHRIRATLRKAINDLIRAYPSIAFNPAAHVELPSGKRPKAKVWTAAAVAAWQATGQRPGPVMVWTPAQAGAFLDYAEAHDIMLYPMFVLIAHRGLRRGEAVGLRDADIDLDTGGAVISQQIAVLGYTPIVKKVKSDAGERTISVDSVSLAALRDYRARRDRWQKVSGTAWPDTGLFFVQPDGQPWHPETVSERFDRLVTDAGLPPIRLHDLRHGAATYLKAAGADLKDIQETLGHSSITITSDTYTAVILELNAERAKADAAAALIPRAHRRAS
jgi:integrase